MTIKGLFDGHNKSLVTYSQELYEIQLSQTFTLLQNPCYTEDTEGPWGRNLCNSGQELDDVMKERNGISGINWKLFILKAAPTCASSNPSLVCGQDGQLPSSGVA